MNFIIHKLTSPYLTKYIYPCLQRQTRWRGIQQIRQTQQQTSRLPVSTCYYRLPKRKESPLASSSLSPVKKSGHLLEIKRTFAWWRIPLALATASKAQRKWVLLGAIGGSSLLGFLFGPISILVIGGLFGGLSWRIWRQTSKWWKYLPSTSTIMDAYNNNSTSLYSMIRSQVGQHRAEDHVRDVAIQQIEQWAHTDEGRASLLNDFNVEFVEDLTFLPTHASATYTSVQSTIDPATNIKNESTQKEVSLEFWMEALESIGGGGCMVCTKALIDDDGRITLKDIKLTSPDWHLDKHIPLMNQKGRKNGKVIEGEFKDL